MVVVIETRKETAEVPMIEARKLPEEGYDPSKYIVSIGQLKPEVVLLDLFSINVVREDAPEQELDDLADLDDNMANL